MYLIPLGGTAAALMTGALLLQLGLGMSIVLFSVPLSIAVAHNGGAAILLLAVLNANQRIRQTA